MSAPKKCRTKRCRGHVLASARSPWCSRCKSAAFKLAHPLKYAFNLLRCGARRRGIEFTLTFAEYQRFAISSGYADGKGRFKDCLSINRKDARQGYHAWNIEAITVSENSRLGQRQLFVPYFQQLRAQAREAERAVA